jgi:hypothetical protein
VRRAAVVLGAFYLLQSTWVLHAGFDALFPRVTKLVTPDACCASACGCPEDVRARGACCCEPGAKPKDSRTSTASAFDVARCSGLELAMAHAHGTPTVAAFPALELPSPEDADGAVAISVPDVQPRPRDVDKVPL